MNRALVICGATASGKTDLAVNCALALESEVISADSQLIYKQLNIGTAKPTAAEMKGVKHHMIDVIPPNGKFSVADYCAAALPVIEGLFARGKTPVICGGTGFYINSLLFDFGYGKTAADENVRKKYALMAEEEGKDKLFSLLQTVDPQTASTLHPNDVKRVIRALEIYEVSGRRKSEQMDGQKKRFDYVAVAPNYPREVLYDRINARVDAMFNAGLVDEVKNLLADGIDENCLSMQAIGYKEVLECLKNGDNDSTMRDIIKQNTRRYAKRQITFFKKLPGIVWLEPQDISVNKVLEILNDGKH